MGSQAQWVNANGTFSLDKWKARLLPYRSINFSSYIADGTIIGNYLIDEPNDPTNWAGTTVSPATLDEMAMYSKQIWPTMPTIVRVSPSYLKGHTYQYLDAAWAQYHSRFGDVADLARQERCRCQGRWLGAGVGGEYDRRGQRL